MASASDVGMLYMPAAGGAGKFLENVAAGAGKGAIREVNAFKALGDPGAITRVSQGFTNVATRVGARLEGTALGSAVASGAGTVGGAVSGIAGSSIARIATGPAGWAALAADAAGLVADGVKHMDANYTAKQYDSVTGQAHGVNNVSVALDGVVDAFDGATGAVHGAYQAANQGFRDVVSQIPLVGDGLAAVNGAVTGGIANLGGLVCGIVKSPVEALQRVSNVAGVELAGAKEVAVNSDEKTTMDSISSELGVKDASEMSVFGNESFAAAAKQGNVSAETVLATETLAQAGLVSNRDLAAVEAENKQSGSAWLSYEESTKAALSQAEANLTQMGLFAEGGSMSKAIESGDVTRSDIVKLEALCASGALTANDVAQFDRYVSTSGASWSDVINKSVETSRANIESGAMLDSPQGAQAGQMTQAAQTETAQAPQVTAGSEFRELMSGSNSGLAKTGLASINEAYEVGKISPDALSHINKALSSGQLKPEQLGVMSEYVNSGSTSWETVGQSWGKMLEKGGDASPTQDMSAQLQSKSASADSILNKEGFGTDASALSGAVKASGIAFS